MNERECVLSSRFRLPQRTSSWTCYGASTLRLSLRILLLTVPRHAPMPNKTQSLALRLEELMELALLAFKAQFCL